MTSADLFHRAAARHLAEGDPAAARDAARAGLRVAAEHPGLNEAAGLAEYALENAGPAVHYLEAASLFGPLGVEGQLALADLYAGFGQVQSSAAILRFLAEDGRCPTPLLPDVARGLGRVGEYDTALEVCRRLTVLRPTYHPAWFGVAVYLRQVGRPAGAVVLPLETAVGLAPHGLLYRVHLAATYADLGRLDDAYELVKGVPADAVGCPCPCRRLAAAFAHAGDLAGLAAYRARAGGTTDDTEIDW